MWKSTDGQQCFTHWRTFSREKRQNAKALVKSKAATARASALRVSFARPQSTSPHRNQRTLGERRGQGLSSARIGGSYRGYEGTGERKGEGEKRPFEHFEKTFRRFRRTSTAEAKSCDGDKHHCLLLAAAYPQKLPMNASDTLVVRVLRRGARWAKRAGEGDVKAIWFSFFAVDQRRRRPRLASQKIKRKRESELVSPSPAILQPLARTRGTQSSVLHDVVSRGRKERRERRPLREGERERNLKNVIFILFLNGEKLST